jgi:hypothetical protein
MKHMKIAFRRLPIVFLLTTFSVGCSKFQEANPWDDRSVAGDTVSTPSANGVYAANKQPVIRTRNWEQTSATYENQGVTHWPLWWEDPFSDKGSEDGMYAWTYEDYLAMPYGLGRFILNTMAWPVSATVTHPFTVMESDGDLSKGGLGYDHDAEPYKPRSSTEEPLPDESPTTEPLPTPQPASAPASATP